MIRVSIFGDNAYGFDVTDWENQNSESGFYNNLLEEDLIERVNQGDVILYFTDNKSAEEWCYEHDFNYELVHDED